MLPIKLLLQLFGVYAPNAAGQHAGGIDCSTQGKTDAVLSFLSNSDI